LAYIWQFIIIIIVKVKTRNDNPVQPIMMKSITINGA